MSEVVDISPETLIPACVSSSPSFLMMYTAYKLNKQSDNIQVLTYSFPNLEPVHCSMSGSNCCFLTCIQVSQEASKWSGVASSLRIFHSLLCSMQSKALA